MFKRIISILLAMILIFSTYSEILSAVSFSSENEAVAFSDDEYAYFEGHIYQRIDRGMTWSQAKEYCESIGGHLATITSADEQMVVQNLIKTGTKYQYWLGGYHDKNWVWVTGEEWKYSNWGHSEPNNYRSVESYLEMYRVENPHSKDSNYYGKWNDISNDNHIKGEEDFFTTSFVGIVCEFEDGLVKPGKVRFVSNVNSGSICFDYISDDVFTSDKETDTQNYADKYAIVNKVTGNEINNNNYRTVRLSTAYADVGTINNCTVSSENTILSITIDGTPYALYREEYEFDDNIEPYDIDDLEVVYFIDTQKRLAGFEIINYNSGILNSWDTKSKTADIGGKLYHINYLTKIEDTLDISSCIGKDVMVGSLSDGNIIYIFPKKEFIMPIYRANTLLAPDNELKQKKAKTLFDILSSDTPSEIEVSELNKTGFNEGLMIWNSLKLIGDTVSGASSLYGFAAEPKDMYTAIIMSMFNNTGFANEIIDEINSAGSKATSVISFLKNKYNAELNLDLSSNKDFKKLTGDQRATFFAEFEEEFKKTNGALIKVEKISGWIESLFEAADSIEDFYNMVTNYTALYYATDSMKAVVSQLYKDSLKSGNTDMTLALLDCVDIINSASDEMEQKIVGKVFTSVGVKGIQKMFDSIVWDSITSAMYLSNPAAAVFMSCYNGSVFITDSLASTDELSSKYLEMKVILDFEQLAEQSVNNLGAKYLEDPSVENAEAFLASLNIIFRLKDEDCNRAYNFLKVLDDAKINKVEKFFGKDNFGDALKQILYIQSNYNIVFRDCSVNWIYNLDTDYPGYGLYEKYKYLLDYDYSGGIVKELTAECPVNIFVCDTNGNTVAFVKGDQIHCIDDNIVVVKNEDAKIIQFYGAEKYRIEYVGYDAGTMDVTIHEFDESGNTVRDVNYYGVPVDSNTSYDIYANDENLKEDAYYLTNTSTGEVVDEQYDSLKDRTEDNIFTAEIWSGNMIYKGNICFSENFSKGESVEIHAFVPENYTFVKWEASNGEDIFGDSTDPNTSFIMPGKDIVVRAILRSNTYNITPTTGVKLDKDKITLNIGETAQLVHTVFPENATEKNVLWISDAPEVVKVDKDGKITALKGGEAVISVSTFDGGYTATCEVTVVGNNVGDVNSDGRISSVDAVLVLRYLANFHDENVNVSAMDYNGTGGVTSLDAVLILRHIAGLD